MKHFPSAYKHFLLGTLLLGGFATLTQAAPAKPGTAKKAKVPKKGKAVERAEAILGHPLTPAQVDAIHAAVKERGDAIKPIQAKFNAAVAKTLGMSLDELKKRDLAVKAAEKAKAKAAKPAA